MLGELSVRGRTVGRCKKHADESRRNVRTRGTENTQTTTHNQGGPPGRPSQIPSVCSLFPRALCVRCGSPPFPLLLSQGRYTPTPNT